MLPFKPNKEYTTIALYAGAVSAITIAIALLVFRFADVRGALAPVFVGKYIHSRQALCGQLFAKTPEVWQNTPGACLILIGYTLLR